MNARQAYGIITKPDRCFICSKKTTDLDKHHENYALPDEVVWLCRHCHKSRHKQLKAEGWIDRVEPESKQVCINQTQPLNYDCDVIGALPGLFESTQFTRKEREVLTLRAMGQTLQQIGDKYNVSRERIRQIIRQAEQKYDKANLLKETA